MSLMSDNEFSKQLDNEVGDFLREHTNAPHLYSNAMRHIYASAVFTQLRGKGVSHLYGVLNEIVGLSGWGDMITDLDNNKIGREYGEKYPNLDRKSLLMMIFEDLQK